MSIEESADLMDLFEYDEFVFYDDHTYHLITESKCSTENGIPLSVELSASLNENPTPVSEQPSNGFVKAPEIFLRIDSRISTTEIRTSSSENSDSGGNHKNENGPENYEKSNSLDMVLPSNQECVELQYENEFVGPYEESDKPDCIRSAFNRHNSIEKDYEDLLFEGIIN